MTARTTRRQVTATARRARTAVPVALAVTGALLLAGCGDQTDGASESSKVEGSKAPLFDKLPKKVQDKGVIKVGTDAAYKPMEYKIGNEIVGLDPDLADAMSKELGVRFEFIRAVRPTPISVAEAKPVHSP